MIDALAIALGLPETVARPRDRGQVAVEVAGRAFAHVADDGRTVAVKATRQEQAALAGQDPAVYTASHVSGRFGWVVVRLDRVDEAELRELLTEAWLRSAPRRLVAELVDQHERDQRPTGG